jgi:hypothetical protein
MEIALSQVYERVVSALEGGDDLERAVALGRRKCDGADGRG